MTHPHPNRRFVPQAVLTRSGKINTAGASVNTAVRPVNTAGSKPTVNHPRPISNAYKKGYSQVTRPFNKYSANKNSIFNKKVNTVRVKDTTTRDRAVVSKNKGKGANAVKASACWGNPQHKEYKKKELLIVVFLFGPLRIETSGIIKTFITEIENQLDYKVKVIRSDNGTEFKNSVMNQFCEMKGIKREFSVARTPQQNSVAERRNRTLIEAARTMLVDSKLPTTFWAEAVNTACYVLNRVLVIKPHNKTPYELIRGRTPLIDFMKPFGCPVTILNTRDHLGKFDGKADEGFFLLGTQTNGIAGTRDYIVTGQAKKKTEPEQEYILIPFCTTDPLISQGPKDSEEDSGMKPTEMDVSGALDKDGKDDQATRSEFERLLQQEKQTVHPNSTNSINTISTPVSAVGPSFTNDDPSSPVNAAEASNAFEEHLFERFSPFKNAFTLPPVSNVTPMDDTGIFGNAYDDEDVGAEADLNNLETTMNVSPIPTTRIDKDHPKDQIIGDFNSAIQTREE
ncbi:putative ribonuclease H-like domain-containing protein [Tanacetum coccineum]